MIVLSNGTVITMDSARPLANSVGISDDGRIAWIDGAASANARRVDLHGRTVVPGFNDSHMHVLAYGLMLLDADLSPNAGIMDLPALIRALQAWVEANPRSEWVRGNRYDQNLFPGAKHPTRTDLDVAFPDRPVYIIHTSEHAAAANSIALKLAGVTRDTPDPTGGVIVRDERGEPTGVLLESAMELVADHLPTPDRAGMVTAINRACGELVKVGITAASDLSTGLYGLQNEVAAYRQAAAEGATVRVTLYPTAAQFGSPEGIPERASLAAALGLTPDASRGTPGLRLGPLKLFADGALTTRTAALRDPFVDGSGSGMLLRPPDELAAYIRSGHAKGWQIATHAIGDRAIELVLDCYQVASRESHGASDGPDRSVATRDSRHRIEHCMLLDDGLIRRIAKLDVIPTLQPEFLAYLGDAYVLGLGEARASRLNPAASLLRTGIPVPFGSDCPVVPGAPLDGIRAAMRRTTRSGRVLGEPERISAVDAARCYTHRSAYATFDEGEIGRIAPGLRADFAVLDGSLTAEEIDAAQVAATIIGGEVVAGGLD